MGITICIMHSLRGRYSNKDRQATSILDATCIVLLQSLYAAKELDSFIQYRVLANFIIVVFLFMFIILVIVLSIWLRCWRYIFVLVSW